MADIAIVDGVYGADEFQTLRYNEWLESDVLYAALTKLAAARPGTVILSPQKVHRVATDSFGSGGDDDTAALITQLRATILAAPAQVFIPINLHRAHWLLAVVDNRTRTIKYYDSLASALSRGVRALMYTILPLLMPDGSFYTRTFYQSPAQPGGSVECGVAVLLSALQLMVDPALTDIPELRRGLGVEPVMYWLAGRVVMLELCRGGAEAADVRGVEASLGRAVFEAKKWSAGLAASDAVQCEAMERVYDGLVDLNDGGVRVEEVGEALRLVERVAELWVES